MRRLLVANRGEIAVRVIRACREAGIAPVAVYSEADSSALHVALADSAVCIGPPLARESYLHLEAVLSAAGKLGADAIHPGYGFLSENPLFPEACERAGIAFLGPPAHVMRVLGDKIAAKSLADKARVPVAPGYRGESQSDRKLAAAAEEIGYPVLIKAAAGGGGRGMRVCASTADFLDRLREARTEARAGFGDDRLLLERYIERPRHIEVQVLGDRLGNVVHLFERECSIQRRHQKVIEEAPSPALTPGLREEIVHAAVRLAKAARYESAGTVEFLFEDLPDGGHRFYFLEVNARLQVEHPVTEAVTGIDLVRAQIEIAKGLPLPCAQEQIRCQGHAIEARIAAEDAAKGFLPSTGTISLYSEPRGPGVRVDSGFEAGREIPPYYDSLLAKLIVHGSSRERAIERLSAALREFHILGLSTTIPFLLDVFRDPQFDAGNIHTGFLEERFADWKPESDVPDEALLAVAALAPATVRRPSRFDHETGADPWRSHSGWRNA